MLAFPEGSSAEKINGSKLDFRGAGPVCLWWLLFLPVGMFLLFYLPLSLIANSYHYPTCIPIYPKGLGCNMCYVPPSL